MRKEIVKLIIVIIFGAILSACNTLKREPALTFTPIRTLPPTATKTSISTNTPQATVLPTLTATQLPTMGSTRISAIDQMVQVYVPAGDFIMGSDDENAKRTFEGRSYPEIPVNTVYLDGYWIDKYEVSNSQYKLCVEAGACQPPLDSRSHTRDNYFGNPEYSNYPVIWVSWYKARTYCEWTGRRLPTEAEWEKAARGTDGRKYPWGNEPLSGERANFCDINCPFDYANELYNDGYADTSPVGNYPAGASPYGVMDMSGNVWEWTGTIIKPYPYDPSDGRENLDAPTVDERAWRGGPWKNSAWWMRSTVRYRSVPWYSWETLGFRCASSGN